MVVAEVCSTMKYPKRSQYKHAKQKKYHLRNWAEYNEGLRRRRDLTVRFDEEAITNWKADKTGKSSLPRTAPRDRNVRKQVLATQPSNPAWLNHEAVVYRGSGDSGLGDGTASDARGGALVQR